MKTLVLLIVLCFFALKALAQDPPPLDLTRVSDDNYRGTYKLSEAVDTVFWQKESVKSDNKSRKKFNRYVGYLKIEEPLPEKVCLGDSVLNGQRAYYFFVSIKIKFAEGMNESVSVKAERLNNNLLRFDLSEAYNKFGFASEKKAGGRYVYHDGNVGVYFGFLEAETTKFKLCINIKRPKDSSARL